MPLKPSAEPEDDGAKIGLTVYLLKPDKVEAFQHEVMRNREVRRLAEPLDGEFIMFPSTSRQPAWVDVVRSVLQDPAQFELWAQSPLVS